MAKEKKQPSLPMKERQTLQFSDDLANELLDTINTKFKKQSLKTAYYLDDPDNLSDITGWVSTGLDTLDFLISNRPNGGLPVGRITEITGLEASGKSLLAAHIIVETQKQGGLGVFIDTEAATSKEFFKAVGVDTTKMLYIPLQAIEDVFETIETVIEKIRSSNKDRIVTIVVDSVMGASTLNELEGGHSQEGYGTDKAKAMSKSLRKVTNLIARQKICMVFTNQLREKIGAMIGDKWGTSGGKALAFHASVRLRIQSVGQIKAVVKGIDQVIGIKTETKVQKNRIGPPLRKLRYETYFDSGIDNYGSWFNILKDYKVIKGSGAWYSYKFNEPMNIDNPDTAETGVVDSIKFQSKSFASFLENNSNLKQELYAKLSEYLVLEYNSKKDFNAEDLIVDTDEDSGEHN